MRLTFGVGEERGWFLFNFEDSVLYERRTFEDPSRSTVTHSGVPVRNRDDWRDDVMGAAFAQAALDEYRRDDCG